jgi:PhnB protein
VRLSKHDDRRNDNGEGIEMKYLLLAYGNEAKFNELSKQDLAKLGETCMAFDEELRATGKLIGGGSLGWSSKKMVLKAGKLTVTDGPFLDTKEVVGGFIFIEADSYDEAVKIASLHPAARMGEELGWGIELRQMEHCMAVEAALGVNPRAKVSTYLSFPGNTEEAFRFYKQSFRTEFVGPIRRMKDAPAAPGMPPLSEKEKNMVMHVELPAVGGHVLMGTDAIESMGHKVTFGTNVSINLEPATRAETDRLFLALGEGGKVAMPLQDMFWGSYFGMVVDRFGVQWMFNCAERKG